MLKEVIKFSKNVENESIKNLVVAGVEIARHYAYKNSNKNGSLNHYEKFAQGDYEEKNKIFNESFTKTIAGLSGLGSVGLTEFQLQTNPTVQTLSFAVVSQILDIILPQTILDNFYRFAEVKNVGWGDNLVFKVPSRNIYTVSKIAHGIRKGSRQRLGTSDIALNPVMHEVTIYEEFYRIASGKVDWGMYISNVALAFETQITTDIYSALYDSYSSLGTEYKANTTFAQDTFVELAQRVQAANRGARAVCFGTKVALSRILPDNNNLKFGLGQDYVKSGYLASAFGVDFFELEQRITPNTNDFAVNNTDLYIVSMGLDKPVKIGFEGETIVKANNFGDNADLSMEHTLMKSYEAKVATSSKYGIYRLTA